MPSRYVFDVTADSFQTEVVQRSVDLPILLDFWAAWCGPCRTLSPVLDKVAEEYGGAFLVGKVDTESQPELAQAFGIQSIPFVVLLIDGRPASHFSGAVGEPELVEFLAKAGIQPAGAAPQAEVEEPGEVKVRAAREAAARGDVAAARAALEEFPEESPFEAARERLSEGLDFLDATIDANTPAGASLIRAREQLAAGQIEPAMEEILTSIETDRGFAGGLGRRAMLLCFSLLGDEGPAVDSYRRRLATLLY